MGKMTLFIFTPPFFYVDGSEQEKYVTNDIVADVIYEQTRSGGRVKIRPAVAII